MKKKGAVLSMNWLLKNGILVMVYQNPYITGSHNPLYTIKTTRGPFFHCSHGESRLVYLWYPKWSPIPWVYAIPQERWLYTIIFKSWISFSDPFVRIWIDCLQPKNNTLPKNQRLEGPKMMGLGKGNQPLKMAIFGIYVRFLGCTIVKLDHG